MKATVIYCESQDECVLEELIKELIIGLLSTKNS